MAIAERHSPQDLIMTRRGLLIATVALPFVFDGISNLIRPTKTDAQSTTINRPEWNVGDSWTYEYQSKGTKVEQTFTVLNHAENGYVVQLKTGKNVQVINGTEDLVLKGSFYVYDWPLEVGKVWHTTLKGTAFNGGAGEWKFTYKAAAMGPVTVPAGTFDSILIQGRQCNVDQNNVCGTFKFWYAPEVKSYVKTIIEDESYWGPWAGLRRELTKYKPANL